MEVDVEARLPDVHRLVQALRADDGDAGARDLELLDVRPLALDNPSNSWPVAVARYASKGKLARVCPPSRSSACSSRTSNGRLTFT